MMMARTTQKKVYIAFLVLSLCQASHFKPNQSRAAFVYLVHKDRVHQLRDSLTLLYEHFLMYHGPYPIFLFHDTEVGKLFSDEKRARSIVWEQMANVHWIFLRNYTSFPPHYVRQSHTSQQIWYASTSGMRPWRYTRLNMLYRAGQQEVITI